MIDDTEFLPLSEPKQKAQASGPYGSLVFWHHLLVVLFVLLLGLYFGAGFLIPLAVAFLSFILLTAVVDWIENMRPSGYQIPRWLARVLGLLLILVALGGIATILAGQASDVVAAIPRYQERFAQIASRLAQFAGEDLTSRASVEIRQLNLPSVVAKLVGSASSFLSGIVLVLIYIPFMIAERVPMRKKIALAASSPQAALEFGQVLKSISVGLQRYIGIKTLVSLLTGTLSYAVMKPVGLDFAETWAVLVFALNFIPTLGSILAVAIPAIVALVQFETLPPFLIVVVGCGAIQFLIGNILDPALTGKSLNLSPLMVILALTFWTTVWGIPGAFLSVPLTVCILIILANLPDTRPLAVLMSGDGHLVKQNKETPAKPEES